MKNDFYVYVWFRPWNGTPCYVGKGREARYKVIHHVHQRNPHLSRIIAKANGALPIVIVRSGLTEAEAFETEKALIAAIGRKNLGKGPLANLTDGGEGNAGAILSEERKRRTSETHKKRAASPDYVNPRQGAVLATTHKDKLRQGRDAYYKARGGVGNRRGVKVSEETRVLMSQVRAEQKARRDANGEDHPLKGKPLTDATRAKLKAAWIARKARGDYGWNRGLKMTPEQKRNMKIPFVKGGVPWNKGLRKQPSRSGHADETN